MKLSQRTHRHIRLKNTLLTLVFLALFGVLAWLGKLYPVQVDITANAGNSLSLASQKLLASLPDKIQLTAYIKKGQPARLQIEQLIDRYRRYKADFTLTFVDPDTQPEKSRELDIGPGGVVIVDYQGRSEKLSFIDESILTNALLQLASAEERWISFLAGHGERSPEGIANFDLGEFGKELTRRKIRAQMVNLAAIPDIPENSALLVISAPAVPLLEGEIDIIRHYIERGGNLLMLGDPDNKQLAVIQEQLGIRQLPGVIVDSKAKLYGVDDPTFVLADEYVEHPITKSFKTITLYPVVAALEFTKQSGFNAVPLFSSSKQSWTEMGAITNSRFTANSAEKQGPLVFAYALTRKLADKNEQRIVVVGDGDFLANAYIGNVGNLDMGLRMLNWLIHDDRFIDIPAKIATDKSLQLSQMAVALMGFGFLIVLPLLLTGTGLLIWRKRKRY